MLGGYRMKLKTESERKYFKERVRPLSLEKKNKLIVKLYLDSTTLKLLAALFECDIQYVVQLLEQQDIKKCTQCKLVLSRSEFQKKGSTDGLNSRCKACAHVYRKSYHEKNREKGISASNEWRRNNLDRVNELRRIRNKTPEHKLKNAKYMRDRRHSDPTFRLRMNFSNLISYSLKNYAVVSSKQGYSWETILEYNLEDLIVHLEKQFQPGMNWENYGRWHIDHIIPQSFYRFESIDDPLFHKCWELNNLQPLWAEDNLKKSDRIIG